MLSGSLKKSPQNSLYNIIEQFDQKHLLIALGNALDWQQLEQVFASLYSNKGRKAKPIRSMYGLLMLKMYNLSDKSAAIPDVCGNPWYRLVAVSCIFSAPHYF